ncbi:hypothetical protein HYDPIDRAFT_42870 [Hydnomerulius pinastri MD-312]|uniref:Major facilitator superfamily (MFS) profile domain-containing protein n=1 Tax=Hydnomerulius pinastri MD-312 TaxID=994086 RepID=A0A0C9WBT1_9AGAM|nr:hypothetical protein HYDPIDRAFT_42870 [Hydnomerulius pinastri MD-312]
MTNAERAFSASQDPVSNHRDFGFLVVPKQLRYDPAHPFHFGTWTKVAFGLGCTLIVANLYYCQPLLIQISNDFRVTYAEVSRVPTLYQAGYCVGLFFLSPLGDLVRRRQLIMILVSITTCVSIGLAVSRNIHVFQALVLLLGVANVTPQILIPFAADLAPPKHRASAVSVLQAGLMLGILLARVVAGVIGYFSSWRAVYYMAIGVQSLVLCGVYLIVPDQPPKNRDLTYFRILQTMLKYAVTEPKLIQAAFINVASVACWSNFWVTLTFLLGGPPYNYSTLIIGLFSLVGILGIFSGPLVGRLIDRLGPWLAILTATICLLLLQTIETAAGGINIAAVAIFCFGLDAFRQAQTVSLQTIVFSISEEARSRLNAVLTLSLFAGQVIGSSVGSQVFLQYGWRAASALSMAFYGWQLFVLFLRGPNCQQYTWYGYEGGFSIRRKPLLAPNTDCTPTSEAQSVFDTQNLASSPAATRGSLVAPEMRGLTSCKP